MNLKTVGAWTLAAVLGSVSAAALAGSTGPTNPDNGGPKVPGTGMEKNTDGTTPGAPGTSPGTKGMDPQPGNNSGMNDKTHDAGKGGMDNDGDDQDDDDDSAP
ncbi:hypothetical protein SAMN05216593_102426 [Pseudomonas asturiensis]|uniref:Serine protease autotransporter n=1 Tax=Pseudomonas asturiensis TaxID=1190415 RepID=A0A1M7KW69_9PSED|nr:hypothetical protein [Pseudomonas asturiensis]SHM69760.1 hypothetical protein SAMN05216593_102426 [Pseudomonas asturiensis]